MTVPSSVPGGHRRGDAAGAALARSSAAASSGRARHRAPRPRGRRLRGGGPLPVRGTVPVDAAWDVDFATGGSVKWLCGGRERATVRRPRLQPRLQPRVTGWMAHEHRSRSSRRHRLRRRMRRGSCTARPPFRALRRRAGYEIVAALGVDAIRRKSVRQVQLLMDRARARGLTPAPRRSRPPWRHGHPRGPQRRSGDARAAAPEIIVDHRPGRESLFPHLHDGRRDPHAIDQTREIPSGAYQAHVRAGQTGFEPHCRGATATPVAGRRQVRVHPEPPKLLDPWCLFERTGRGSAIAWRQPRSHGL
jgi:hypothetical protein